MAKKIDLSSFLNSIVPLAYCNITMTADAVADFFQNNDYYHGCHAISIETIDYPINELRQRLTDKPGDLVPFKNLQKKYTEIFISLSKGIVDEALIKDIKDNLFLKSIIIAFERDPITDQFKIAYDHSFKEGYKVIEIDFALHMAFTLANNRHIFKNIRQCNYCHKFYFASRPNYQKFCTDKCKDDYWKYDEKAHKKRKEGKLKSYYDNK